ncbi:MAG: outer membrane beta-barrel protein [Bacteroidales bacterium]
MDQRDYIDNQFRERFQEYSVEPPAEAWHAIQQGIKPAAGRRLIPMWLRAAAAVAALITAGLSFWLAPRQDSKLAVEARHQLPGEASLQDYIAYENIAVPMQERAVTIPVNHNNGILSRSHLMADDSHQAADPIGSALSSRLGLLNIPNSSELMAFRQDKEGFSFSARSFEPLIAMNQTDDVYPNVSLGAHVISQYNYRQTLSHGYFGASGIPFENLEEPLYTLSYGLSATIGLSEIWSIQTGVNYRNMGQYLNDIMAFSSGDGLPLFQPAGSHAFNHPQTIITSQGSIRLNEPTLYFADAQSFRVLTNKQAMANQDPQLLSHQSQGLSQFSSFLEIPLMVRARLFEKSVGLHVKGGLSGTYLLKNAVYLGRDMNQQPIGETYGLRTVNLSAIGGLMLSVPLSGRLTLHFEPTGQIFLMPMVKDEFLTGKVLPFNFSLFSSFTYRF